MPDCKQSIYFKIFLNNTIVIVTIVGILSVFFYGSIVNEVKDNRLYINKKLTEDTANYIKNIESNNRYINRYLYQANSELMDLIHYLKLEEEDYLKYRLDEYTKSNKNIYYGLDYFVSKTYESSENVVNIGVYSYLQNRYTQFDKTGRNKKYDLNEYSETIDQKKLDYKNNRITLIQAIKDPVELQNLGELIISYTLEPIDRYLLYNTDHEMIILDSNYYVVYDSAGDLEGKPYPYIKEGIIKQNELEDLTDSYINVEHLQDGYTVIGLINKNKALHVSLPIRMTFFFLILLLVIVGELSVYFKLNNLDKRMRNILDGMNDVVQGRFNVTIEEKGSYDDELSIITQSFNKMCHELGNYIEKSYLAEIKQKDAEMKALQSQINPHFLYNTLESIRMKAICNGDREVGKMLQNLAIIFRSQIKENNVITIAKELHYCKKYMELFSFRYENNFRFTIVCDEMYLSKSILKFTLQPIIENYFVHGIRLEDTDNYIEVKVTGSAFYIEITIEDNGCGMTNQKIEEMNNRLETCQYEGQSMGVINVHERLVMTYGKAYGIKVMANEPKGLKVSVTIPNREEKEDV